jgi:hypothetical protein
MADHVHRLMVGEDGAEEIRNAFATSCSRDDWGANVRDCIRATTTLADPQNCRRLMSASQGTSFDAAIAAVEKGLRGKIPPVCRDYEAMVQRIAGCSEASQEVRDDLTSKLADHKRAWETMDNKSSLQNVCGSGITALKSAFPECLR